MSQLQPASTSYEFDESHNTTIRSLAGAMKFVAVIEIILGILYGAVAALAVLTGRPGSALVYAITSVITIILAVMLSGAARHFRTVVDTRGSDIPHLVAALEHLGRYFNLKRVLYIIALALIGVAILFVVLFQIRA